MWRRVIGTPQFLRAPKKGKKGDEKVAVVSTDLINIFVDKKDPEIKPLDQYPSWLRLLCEDQSISKVTDWAIDIAKGDQRNPIDPVKMKHHQRFLRKAQIELRKRISPPAFFNPKVDDLDYDWEIVESIDIEEEDEDHLDPIFRLAAGSSWENEKERERLRVIGQGVQEEEDEPEPAPVVEAKVIDRRAEAAKQKQQDKETEAEIARMMRKNK